MFFLLIIVITHPFLFPPVQVQTAAHFNHSLSYNGSFRTHNATVETPV